jgi:hypothetical protein
MWPFNTDDCLKEVTALAGLTLSTYTYIIESWDTSHRNILKGCKLFQLLIRSQQTSGKNFLVLINNDLQGPMIRTW